MPKREEYSFATNLLDASCVNPDSEHLSRQAPRGKRSEFLGAGNVIPMKQKRTPSPPDEAETGANLTNADKRRMTDQIGRQLRGMYDGILNQPVPDRFMDLVKQLEHAKTGSDRDQ